MFVVQASPLTKIFLKDWEIKCLENPELIDSTEPFDILIPRATGGIRLSHMKPVHAATLIPRQQKFKTEAGREVSRITRAVEDDEITPLVYWLTGGPENVKCDETDIWGVVLIDIESDYEATIQDLMVATLHATTDEEREVILKKSLGKQRKFQAAMNDKMREARARADERVKKALKITHDNLLKSWESLKADGKGTYAPSVQENLGYHVIKAEMDRRLELNRRYYNEIASGIPGAERK